MKTITILGAGGKMGGRITDCLRKTDCNLLLVETSPTAQQRVLDKGLQLSETVKALAASDVVIFALPDRLLGRLTAEFVPQVKPDTLLILLDPAAVYAEEAYIREDCTYVVIHPCHPQLFFEQEGEDARNDHFGGVAAKQDVVISFVSGNRSRFPEAQELSKQMFAPVMNSFEITVEQMAMLEPAATEVVNTCLIQVMGETLDEIIRMGIPEEAARSFVLGHAQMGLSIILFKTNPMSDAAAIAAKAGYDNIINPDWKKTLDPAFTREIVRKMLHPQSI